MASAYFFSLYLPGSVLMSLGLPILVIPVVAAALALVLGRITWKSTSGFGESVRQADAPRGAMALGALIVGAISFAAGFFGPMIFDPGANQGPLLGIFITGPLGAFVGMGVGWWWWAKAPPPDHHEKTGS
jgi:hypothetical protein